MLPFTIYSILGDISLGLSITELLGSVRSRNGKQQWPEQSLLSYISPMKLICQYRLERLHVRRYGICRISVSLSRAGKNASKEIFTFVIRW